MEINNYFCVREAQIFFQDRLRRDCLSWLSKRKSKNVKRESLNVADAIINFVNIKTRGQNAASEACTAINKTVEDHQDKKKAYRYFLKDEVEAEFFNFLSEQEKNPFLKDELEIFSFIE
jgi:hypothetical protein